MELALRLLRRRLLALSVLLLGVDEVEAPPSSPQVTDFGIDLPARCLTLRPDLLRGLFELLLASGSLPAAPLLGIEATTEHPGVGVVVILRVLALRLVTGLAFELGGSGPVAAAWGFLFLCWRLLLTLTVAPVELVGLEGLSSFPVLSSFVVFAMWKVSLYHFDI